MVSIQQKMLQRLPCQMKRGQEQACCINVSRALWHVFDGIFPFDGSQ